MELASEELKNDIREMLKDPRYAPLTKEDKVRIFNNALTASMHPDKHPPYSKDLQMHIEALKRFREEHPIDDRSWVSSDPKLKFSGNRRSRKRRSRKRHSRKRRSRKRRSRKRVSPFRAQRSALNRKRRSRKHGSRKRGSRKSSKRR